MSFYLCTVYFVSTYVFCNRVYTPNNQFYHPFLGCPWKILIIVNAKSLCIRTAALVIFVFTAATQHLNSLPLHTDVLFPNVLHESFLGIRTICIVSEGIEKA